MTAEQLRNLLSWIPFVEPLSSAEDGNVSTVMCRIAQNQEGAWEQLAGQWLAQMPPSSALLVAKQLQYRGRLGYLWNVSLFSSDPEPVLQMMQSAVKALSAPAPQAQSRPAVAGQGSMPPLRAAQVSADHVGRADAVTPEFVEAELANSSNRQVVREVPLYGAGPNRNRPAGTATGAKGRRFPSERGASTIGTQQQQ